MSWIAALSTSVTTTPVLATAVGLVRPRPRSALRTAAFASVATLAASRVGLPLLDLVPSFAAAANTGLTSVATCTALAWLGSLAPRVVRGARRVLRSGRGRAGGPAARMPTADVGFSSGEVAFRSCDTGDLGGPYDNSVAGSRFVAQAEDSAAPVRW